MRLTRHRRSDGEPFDRLTKLCEVMLQAAEASPLYREEDRFVLLMDDDSHGGAVVVGYENDAETLICLIAHVEAFALARGLPVRIVTTADPDDN